MARKRPCRVCGKWFQPHPRRGPRSFIIGSCETSRGPKWSACNYEHSAIACAVDMSQANAAHQRWRVHTLLNGRGVGKAAVRLGVSDVSLRVWMRATRTGALVSPRGVVPASKAHLARRRRKASTTPRSPRTARSSSAPEWLRARLHPLPPPLVLSFGNDVAVG